jgi:hypothetical protein
MLLGTIKKPIIMEDHMSTIYLIHLTMNNIKVNAVKDQIVSIQLYSLTGQIVLDKNKMLAVKTY